jgi:RNA polymerase sigma factor (sigma-70 family)
VLPDHVPTLVRRAANGDQAAWNALVEQYTALLWWTVRKFGLTNEQGADIVQTTWLRLVESIGNIRDPTQLHSWLMTTARRRCIDMAGASAREQPLDKDYSESSIEDGPEERVLRRERQAMVRRAVCRLPERQRLLLMLLTVSPPLSYKEISDRLGMPIGSIGPVRARALRRLRSELAAHENDLVELMSG